MKNIVNSIFIIFVISVICLLNITEVKAIKMIDKSKELEIYEIKTNEDFIIENNDIIKFYNENCDKQIFVKEEIIEEEEEIEEFIDFSFQNEIINYSLQFIGNPYVSGGNSLINGTDCSGFVQLIYSSFGIYLPRTTYEQSISGIEIDIDKIGIGDIISYGYDGQVTHSALYIGDGLIIHASTQELGIRIDNINIMPIITIRRIIY